MLREIVRIDEKLCNGCGDCVPACHEGALQVIDGKARLVSDLMCDGLGACLGHCPQGAITIEKREAAAYDEVNVMQIMVEKGKNTVVAHLKHLKEHNEVEFLNEAVGFLKSKAEDLDFNVNEALHEVHNSEEHQPDGGGCPGSRVMSFQPKTASVAGGEMTSGQSELRQWPVQMHLINPQAGYFQQSDLVIAADCVAYSLGNFHSNYLKEKSLAIACPKLDSNQEIYREKIARLIDDARVNTIHVMIMQVPCCSGLMQLVRQAAARASRKVPVKVTVVSLDGGILQEQWI